MDNKKSFKERIVELGYFYRAIKEKNLEIDDIDYKMVHTRLEEISRKLPNKQSFILNNYFGLNNNSMKTLTEIANIMERSRTMVDTNLAKTTRMIFGGKQEATEYIIGISNIYPNKYKNKIFGHYYDNTSNSIFYGDLKEATRDCPIYYYNIPQQAYGRAYMLGESIYYDEAVLQSDIDEIKENIEKMNNVETKEQHQEWIKKEKKKNSLEKEINKKKEIIENLQNKINLYKQDILRLEKEKQEIEEELKRRGE